MESIHLLSILVLFSLCSLSLSTTGPPSTLRLVHYMHRHGDRSPTKTFPSDQYREDFWPQGFGQLTKLGKQQLFGLGQFIRENYKGFLNATYIREEIYVRSTDKDRTLMSAECALAGMYPPNNTVQEWNEDINWQPIPVHTVDNNGDILLDMGGNCPAYNVMWNEVLYEGEGKEYVENNKDFLNSLTKHAGMPENSKLYDIMEFIPDSLFCEKVHNLTLPAWANEESDFNKIMSLKILEFKFYMYNRKMIKLKSGVFYQELINHTEQFINGPKDDLKKIYHYSAHDSTLSFMLATLDLWDYRIPPYASLLIFELHQFSAKDYRIKVFYKNDTVANPTGEAQQLKLRGCSLDCSYDEFKLILSPFLIESVEKQRELCNETTSNHRGATVALAVIIVMAIIVLLGVLYYYFRIRNKDRIRYQSANFSVAQHT